MRQSRSAQDRLARPDVPAGVAVSEELPSTVKEKETPDEGEDGHDKRDIGDKPRGKPSRASVCLPNSASRNGAGQIHGGQLREDDLPFEGVVTDRWCRCCRDPA